MTRRFGSRQPDNETLVSTHPHPSEGSPDHGIPARRDPLPGEHEYHVSDPVTREQLAVPPAKPYYSGGVAHGVVSPVKHGGRPTPHHDERELYRTEDEAFPPLGKWKGEAIPVRLDQGNRLLRASFRQVNVIPGADPIPIVPRNDTRTCAYLLNETLPPAGSYSTTGSVTNPAPFTTIGSTVNVPSGTYQVTATVFLSGTVTTADATNIRIAVSNGGSVFLIAYPGVANSPVTYTCVTFVPPGAFLAIQTNNGAASGPSAVYNAAIVVTPISTNGGGGVRLKNGPDSEIGSLLPGNGRYFAVHTQDVIYAIADPSATTEQLVSVIEEYSVTR